MSPDAITLIIEGNSEQLPGWMPLSRCRGWERDITQRSGLSIVPVSMVSYVTDVRNLLRKLFSTKIPPSVNPDLTIECSNGKIAYGVRGGSDDQAHLVWSEQDGDDTTNIQERIVEMFGKSAKITKLGSHVFLTQGGTLTPVASLNHDGEKNDFSSTEASSVITMTRGILEELARLKIKLPDPDPNDIDRHVRLLEAPNGKRFALLGEHHGDVASLQELESILALMDGKKRKNILFISEEGDEISLSDMYTEVVNNAKVKKIPSTLPCAMRTADAIARFSGIHLMKIIPSNTNTEALQMATTAIREEHSIITFADVVAFMAMVNYVEVLHTAPSPNDRKESDADIFSQCVQFRSLQNGISEKTIREKAKNDRPEIKILARHLEGSTILNNMYGGRAISKAFDDLTRDRIKQSLDSNPHVTFCAIFAGSAHIPVVLESVESFIQQ